MKRWASLTLVSMLLSGLAAAACDVEAIKAKAAERAQSSQSTAGKSEGAHLEVACVDLRLVSMAPMVVEGDIIFENQGGSALTIRGFAGGASRLIELTKTSRFLGLFESTRPVPTVRVNANSVKELSGDLGYRLTLSEFPSNYGNPGVTAIYIDLGPDNDPNWDPRGQLIIVRYDKGQLAPKREEDQTQPNARNMM